MLSSSAKKYLSFIIISLSAILTGCATTSSDPRVQQARASIWVEENITPIMENDPARAASMLAERLQSTCASGIELGKRPFYAQFKDTDKYQDYAACRTLNGNLTVAYWKAGNYSAMPDHLNQSFLDAMNSPRKNFGETWCGRHRFWYTQVGLDLYSLKNIPPWYEMYARVYPVRAANNPAFMFKRYFCTIHNNNLYSSSANDLAPIRQMIEEKMGKDVIAKIDRYHTEILLPVLFTENTIKNRNREKEPAEQLRAISIEKIALYRNALTHLQRMDLDKVIYNGDPVFLSHLNSLISEAEADLKSYSH